MNFKKLLFASFFIAFIAGLYIWFFVWNKSHRDIQSETHVFEGSATDLKAALFNEDGSIDSSLIDQVVIIHGEIVESENVSYILSHCTICYLDSTVQTSPTGNSLKVKGLLTGINKDDIIYGDLMVIEQSVPIID